MFIAYRGINIMNREVKPKYTLRKLSVGLTSIMIGSTILLTSQQVHAADDSSVEENHQVISKIDNEVKTNVLANNSVADNKDVRATTNQTNNADSAIVTATDVEAKQKSDQTKRQIHLHQLNQLIIQMLIRKLYHLLTKRLMISL